MLGAFALGAAMELSGGHLVAQTALQPKKYDQGNPTDSEQYLLQKLNRARTDPVGEGERLAGWLRQPENSGIVSQYGVNPSQVATDFATMPAVPPLAFHPGLITSARSHSSDLAPHDGIGPGGDDHAGYDGSTPDSRVYASGFRAADGGDGYAGENVGPGAASLDQSHAAFMVDWGVADLSHRRQSMNGSNAMNFVGVGVATKPAGVNAALPIVNTNDFGLPGLSVSGGALVNADVPAMLTGVVYRDADNNGRYDPGEGVAGVTVSMDGGAYYAITTSSGGYSLPLVDAQGNNAAGTIVVRMSGLPDESSDRAEVVALKSVVTSFGSYRANVEWDVPAGQTTGLPVSSLAAFFNGSNFLGQNWYYLALASGGLFGYYNVSEYPYVLHNELGWEYVIDANDGQGGIFLYDFASNDWWYTSASFSFPYIYDFTLSTVLYYFPDSTNPGSYTKDPRYFYSFATKKVITL